MPAEFDNCVNSGGRVRTKKMKDGKYMHVCFLNGKSYAGEVKKKKEIFWNSDFIMEDFEPTEIESATMESDKIKMASGKKIKGCLMKSESRNGRIYELDAMIEAGQLANLPMPISMNHGEDVSDNVGLITKLIPRGDGLDYEGMVFNTAKYPDAIEMMQKGLINKISIEANDPVEEEHNNKVIIKSFELMGAGFVKYAGIPQASVSIAEALDNKEEVETMEEIAELKAKLDAYEKADEKKKLEEAEKAKMAEAEAKKKLEETVATLQAEVKTLKEAKKSGIITTDTPEGPQVIEAYKPGKAFVFENRKTDKACFWPTNPSEYY